jgi:hypothetical protein
MEKDERTAMSAEPAGEQIAAVAARRKVKPLHVVGPGYRVLVCIAKFLPARLLNWAVGLLYAR